MKRFIVLFFLLLSGSLSAQWPDSKVSIDLFKILNDDIQIQHKFLHVLIKGDTQTVKTLSKTANGFLKYAVGDISSLILPASEIHRFVEDSKIKRIEYREVQPAQLFYEDSTADINNKIRPVHSGQGLLPYGFRGEGVVLGIIDDGFEWKHPDFLKEDSSSRIKYLWDQTHVNLLFFENIYAYGSSWNSAAIDSGLITHIPNDHGSHVLGTAAGNARAAGKYIGIAPETEIVAVGINENSGSFLTSFVDGVHYIFSKADLLQMPCAINSSVGTYYGSHDGRDLYSALIDSMLLEKPGRTLVQAAGNARQFNLHWQAKHLNHDDSSRVWFQPIASAAKTVSFLFADTADFNKMNFSFEWIDRNTFIEKGGTSVFNVLRDFNLNGFSPAMIKDTLFYINTQPVVLTIYIEQRAGVYEMYFEIFNPQNTTDYWQLTLSGQGKADIWSHQTVMGGSTMIANGNAMHYRNPDNEQSIVGFWTCSENVVTVASYQNMAWLENYHGDTVALFTAGWLPPGISHFSSLGPTRDGRQKPDLSAPGGQVMSSAPLSTLNNYRNNGFAFIDKEGWHVSNRGTSMAAPMVAGAAALYFQCRPNATALDFKNAVRGAARIDTHVFAQSQQLPNLDWGFGKLDVYNLISGCLLYGCTDSTALNFNPLAHLNDGSCFLPLAVRSAAVENWSFFPNPSNGFFTLNLPAESEQKIKLFSMSGMELMMVDADGLKTLTLSTKITAGAYLLQLQTSKEISVKKLIIQ